MKALSGLEGLIGETEVKFIFWKQMLEHAGMGTNWLRSGSGKRGRAWYTKMRSEGP